MRLLVNLHSLPSPKYIVPQVEVRIDTRASMRELRSKAQEILRRRYDTIYLNTDSTRIIFPSCEYNNTHVGRQDDSRLIDVMGWDISQFTRINAKLQQTIAPVLHFPPSVPLAAHAPAAPPQPSMVSHAPAETAPASAVAEPTAMTIATLAIVPAAVASTFSADEPSSPPPRAPSPTPAQPSTSSADPSTSKRRQAELTEMLNEMRKKMRVLKDELRQMYDAENNDGELRRMEDADDSDSP